MLVPLVAFDDAGTRLGMGGGYYDSFFAEAKGPGLLLIGTAFSEQRATEPLPNAAWDVALDMVVTDVGIIQFIKPGTTWD